MRAAKKVPSAPRFIAVFAWVPILAVVGLAETLPRAPATSLARAIRFDERAFASGDLLFRRGCSLVSLAVLAADEGGDYTHVGLVSVVAGRAWVIHSAPAEEPDERGGVVAEPVARFLAPDRAAKAALYRPLDRRAAAIAERVAWGFVRARLPFDADFDLRTPRALYCTELVWRAYRAAGIDLAPGAAEDGSRYLLPSRLIESRDLRPIQELREEGIRP